MSVPASKRTQSRCEYIDVARRLNITVAQIIANGPKKYTHIYGDRLVGNAIDLYTHAIAANSIFVSRDETAYRARRAHLLEARALSHSVSSVAKLYFDIILHTDGQDKDKAYRRMERIGEYTYQLDNLIGGVLKSDKERYNG